MSKRDWTLRLCREQHTVREQHSAEVPERSLGEPTGMHRDHPRLPRERNLWLYERRHAVRRLYPATLRKQRLGEPDRLQWRHARLPRQRYLRVCERRDSVLRHHPATLREQRLGEPDRVQRSHARLPRERYLRLYERRHAVRRLHPATLREQRLGEPDHVLGRHAGLLRRKLRVHGERNALHRKRSLGSRSVPERKLAECDFVQWHHTRLLRQWQLRLRAERSSLRVPEPGGDLQRQSHLERDDLPGLSCLRRPQLRRLGGPLGARHVRRQHRVRRGRTVLLQLHGTAGCVSSCRSGRHDLCHERKPIRDRLRWSERLRQQRGLLQRRVHEIRELLRATERLHGHRRVRRLQLRSGSTKQSRLYCRANLYRIRRCSHAVPRVLQVVVPSPRAGPAEPAARPDHDATSLM
jgi:hypothetical protein